MDRAGSVVVTVRSQDGEEKCYKIKMDTPISKLLRCFCEYKQLEYDNVVFLIKGKRFKDKKTPAELNLKDGVQIEAFMHQNGGGCNGILVLKVG
ncbi:small ubiquitin-related modifier 2-like isoform X2 [Hevea brasiliensis]|uniref:small ubiquitin-related modifier 2-like isoform X2 n=1 Tax=Hevea brasiliensis TaxID=3981 RepID=UPI000B79526B|nr:small ubiquitin-related modifier 2-like isoform X2 [Hevea brasiliensis]